MNMIIAAILALRCLRSSKQFPALHAFLQYTVKGNLSLCIIFFVIIFECRECTIGLEVMLDGPFLTSGIRDVRFLAIGTRIDKDSGIGI